MKAVLGKWVLWPATSPNAMVPEMIERTKEMQAQPNNRFLLICNPGFGTLRKGPKSCHGAQKGFSGSGPLRCCQK